MAQENESGRGETRRLLNKLGPNVGDRIFGLVDMAASLSPTQDVPDLKQGARELMDGIDAEDMSKVTAGATALAGAIMSLGIPGSYAQYKQVVEELGPLARSVGVGAGEVIDDVLPVVSSRGAGYNPPTVEPRPFDKDYPSGARTDEQGNLTHDIDGKPLVAPRNRIAGRREGMGGDDEAISPAEFDAIAKEGTGRNTATVAPGDAGLPRGALGAVHVDRHTGAPKATVLSKDLDPITDPDKFAAVYGHEIGHVVDQLAGEISDTGLKTELKALYNTLNNSNRSPDGTGAASWGKPATPQGSGYKGDDVPREFMAEAIRAYMADPNYLKTVAPKTAAAIRKAVNSNPAVNCVLQFNNVPWATALPGAAAAALMGGQALKEEE
jgi:hypothetical protein